MERKINHWEVILIILLFLFQIQNVSYFIANLFAIFMFAVISFAVLSAIIHFLPYKLKDEIIKYMK